MVTSGLDEWSFSRKRVTASGNRTRLMGCSNIPRPLVFLDKKIERWVIHMFVLSNFLLGVAKVLDIALTLYMWIIIARAVISWVNPDPYNPIVRFLNSVTEPVLYPIRRRLPISLGGIDFSPILVILAIIFVQAFLIQSLMQLAARLA
jgi:YggT family protein